MDIKDIKRFNSFIKKGQRCWNWKGGINSTGRGIFWLKGKTPKAHRISWIIYIGPIPKNKLVLHKCDNGRCIRPSHLFLGSFKDNTQDMIKKGRNVGNRWITPKYAKNIRKLYLTGKFRYKDLAKRFNISYVTVFEIINKKRKNYV
jgi:hypothetical protein